jgi:hypothetical protein
MRDRARRSWLKFLAEPIFPSSSAGRSTASMRRQAASVLIEADESLPPVIDSLEPEESTTSSTSSGHRETCLSAQPFGLSSVCAVLLCCGIVFLLWQNAVLRSQLNPWRTDPVRKAFWSEFFGSGEEVDIVTADTSWRSLKTFSNNPCRWTTIWITSTRIASIFPM